MRRSTSLAAMAWLAMAACSSDSRPSVDGPAVRLSPLEVRAGGGTDATRLLDRDTSVQVPITSRTTVMLRFARDVAVQRIGVHGASGVQLELAGQHVALPPAAEGWTSASLPHPVAGREVALTLVPTDGSAHVAELELWGTGGHLAPRTVEALGVWSRDAKAEAFVDAWALRATPSDGHLTPDALADGDRCLRARFPAAAPHQARRAWLVFEANVPRAIALQRSIGGEAPREGFWLGKTADTRTLVEELDPERLTSDGELLLCLPEDADAAVDVSGVRLMLGLDSGLSPFDREANAVLGPALDGDDATAAGLVAGPREFHFDRPAAISHAEVRLAAVPATLRGAAVLEGASWRELPGTVIERTPVDLSLTGTAAALRLDFDGPARADVRAASISELTLETSGIGPRVGAPRIVLTSPALVQRGGRDIGERFGDHAFVAGWAESPGGPGIVEIEGARVDAAGAFGTALERPANAGDSWPVTVRARFPDGTTLERTLYLDEDHERDLLGASAAGGTGDRKFALENETAWGLVDPAAGGRVALGTEVLLEAPAGAVGVKTNLSITRKGPEVMPKLDPGMINVTAPAHSGYRFLPHGQKFAKPVQLAIPYDPELLPDGVAPEEIQTYFFDEQEERWKTLPRREVRRAGRQVVSETTHFTFMINAVLVMPDHPGPVSFNPNSIKDLKAADPSTGIDLIEPPQPTNDGSARLSYPLRLPKARGTYQPALAVAYDSAAGDGWLGVGWDLGVPSVSLDTRFGVPQYDGEERYLLQGQQLVPVDPPVDAAAPGTAAVTCVDGTPGRTYAARVEGSFQRIVRCGVDPTQFWFQVEDKAGTLSVYGRSANARLTSYVPRVTSPPTFPPVYDVAQWHLERVVDANGNLTEYGYQHDSVDPGTSGHAEPFRMVYPRSIRYSGRAPRTGKGAVEGGTSGPYLVELLHEEGTRKDVITSGRLGFKMVTRRRLGRVVMSLLEGSPSGVIRSYRLNYEDGDLGKSRLASLDVLGTDGSLFYSHSFEYENKAPDAPGVVLFGGPVPWETAQPPDIGLSGSNEWGFGFHGFVGIGAGPSKSMGAVGLGFGYSRRMTDTRTALIDLNGDGLPDRVYHVPEDGLFEASQKGDRVLFNHGAGGGLSPAAPLGDPAHPTEDDAALPVALDFGKRNIGKDTGNSFDVSLQAFGPGVSANFGVAYSLSQSKDFVLDANGDGLPDLVNDGTVLLNQPRSATCNSASGTCCPAGGFCFANSYPVPALQDLGDSSELVTKDPTLRAADQQLADALVPEDAVLEWTAPFDGEVDVTGALQWSSTPKAQDRRDGVRLVIYQHDPVTNVTRKVREEPWVKSPADGSATPVSVARLSVTRGQLLYFVLSTLSDFPMLDGDTISPVEMVDFAPVITYLGIAEADRAKRDPSGARLFRYDAAADFQLAGEPQGAITLPSTGTLELTLTMGKKTTSDAVRTCVQYFAPDQQLPNPLPPCAAQYSGDSKPEQLYYVEWTPERLVNGETTVIEHAVKAGGTLLVRSDTHVAIDPRAVNWLVQGTMTCVERTAGTCVAPSDSELAAVSFTAQPYLQLHEDLQADSDRWAPSGRGVIPYVTPTAGKLVIDSSSAWADREVPIWFTARTLAPEPAVGGELLFKYSGNAGVGGLPVGGPHVERRLEAGTSLFLEAHTESAKSLGPKFYLGAGLRTPNWNISCRFERDDGTTESCTRFARLTTERRAEGFPQGNAPVLAGGYHGWRYGAWQGKDGAPFEPWVFRSPSTEDQWKDDPDEVKRRKDELKDENTPLRRRLALAGLLVPSRTGTRLQNDQAGLLPDKLAFVSQDGNTFFAAGKVHAGKKGQSASNVQRSPDGTAASPVAFQLNGLGRTSVAVTVSGGVGLDLIGVSGGVSAGLSQQKVDVLDMDGDRIPDVLAAGGLPDISNLQIGDLTSALTGDIHTDVRLTSPATLRTRRKVQLQGLPRINYDLSGQLGMGVSEPIRTLLSDTDLRAVASRFPSISGGVAFNVSSTAQDLVDVNGDGLPDAVRRNAPGCANGFAVRLNFGTSFASSEDCVGVQQVSGLQAGSDSGISGAFGGSGVAKKITFDNEYPDDADTQRGQGFASGMLLDGPVRRNETVTLQGSLGGAFDRVIVVGGGIDRTESYGASLSVESSLSSTNVSLVDVTGDGLPDYVFKDNTPGSNFLVMVNRGYGFAPARPWRPAGSWYQQDLQLPRMPTGGASFALEVLKGLVEDPSGGLDPLEATGTHSVLPSASVAVNFAFPIIPPFPVFWLHVGGGASISPKKLSGFELALQDMDGDGLVDQVLKTRENGPVFARLNKLAGANLLKRVNRPLHGKFDLSFARVGNTVEMPESRWVLEKVRVWDGRTAEEAVGHTFDTRYTYTDGRYDRLEREFLGFKTVKRTNPDNSQVIQEFKNGSVLTKGLLVSEKLVDAEQRVWTETVNAWSAPLPMNLASPECRDSTPLLLNKDSYCGVFFTKLESTEKRFFEGQPVAGIVTRQSYTYDPKANVVGFVDEGDVADPTDDVRATILYVEDTVSTDLYAVSRPESVRIEDGAGRLLRSRTGFYAQTPNVRSFSEAVAGDGVATSVLDWYEDGTLKSVKAPPNDSGQQYQVDYVYDDVTGTYLASTRDSYGLSSTAEYDLRFGEPTLTTDVNGNVTRRQLDAYGRLERLAGPYDTLDRPTVQSIYALHVSPAYALTKNRLPRASGDLRSTLDTVVVVDGMERVIQTKKSAEIATGETTRGIGWSVAGHEEFDAMGRVTVQGQSFASFDSRPDYVPGTPRNPTHVFYDVLGRALQTVGPDAATTRVVYGFGTPPGSTLRRMRTVTTDAEGKARADFKDVAGRTVAVEERLGGPVTTYAYDPLGQVTSITDAAGNVTRLEYDLLGRRTRFTHPDSGQVDFKYDLAGNLTQKADANLRAQGPDAAIRYSYDFNRLTDVKYPDGARDVHYDYGRSEADRKNNAIGRVTQVTDEVGREERTYGKLGELASNTRHIKPLRPGDRWRSFATAFEYDSFGRMLSIRYPDAETVHYRYDAGGLLEAAYGERPATTSTPAQTEVYLESLAYDEFGQRVRMVLGNGVTTRYAYEPLTRRLHTLTTRTPRGRTLQALTYGYDLVGNVRSLVNALGEPVGDQSGAVSFEYRYDDYYRLSWAHGEAKSRPHTLDRFTSTFMYSDIHNMTANVQLHEVVHEGNAETPPKTNHDFSYVYGGKGPHQATRIGDTFLVYDGNGNAVRECPDHGDPTCQSTADHLRRYVWTEENRLDQVIDGGGRNITRFLYGGSGERVVKLGRGGESVTIGQFWSLKGKRAATKHVFAGSTRLASKLLPPPGWDDASRDVTLASAAMVGDGGANANGCDPSDYQPQKCPVLPGGDPVLNHHFDSTRIQPQTYYYHQDHLGSTNWVTDQNARVHEHVEYFPYGEVWRDARSDADGAPVKGQRFLFTSKELDEETGLLHFQKRYYEPTSVRWKSADPSILEYIPGPRDDAGGLPGEGGIFRPVNLNAYHYGAYNPLKFTDPSGGDIYIVFEPAEPGHLGIAVDVRNARGKATGSVMRADYGMAGWVAGAGNGTKARAVLWPFNGGYLNYKKTSAPQSSNKRPVLRFRTTAEVDRAVIQSIEATIARDEKGNFKRATTPPTGRNIYESTQFYNAVGYNCADFVESMLDSAVEGGVWNWDVFPKNVFEDFKKNKDDIQRRIDEYGQKLKAEAAAAEPKKPARGAGKSK